MASIGDWAIKLTANTSGLTSGLKTAESASTSFASRIKALGSPLQSLTGIDLTAAAGQFAPLLQGFGMLGKIAVSAGSSILSMFTGPSVNGAAQAAAEVESGIAGAAVGAADATLIVDGFIWRFLKWGRANPMGNIATTVTGTGVAAAGAAPPVANLSTALGGISSVSRGAVLGIVAAAGAFVALGKKGSDAIKELKKMREELEITVEAAQQLKLVGEVGGVDDIKTTLLKFSEHVGDARKELEKGAPSAFASAIRALGLDAKEILALPIDQSFQRIVEELSKIPDGADRASLAYQIFSRDARNLTDLIAKGGSAWDTAEQRIERFGLAVSELDVSTVSAASKAIKVAGGAISDTFLALSQKAAVALSPVIQFFAGLVSGVAVALQPIFRIVGDVVSAFGELLSGVGDVVGPVFAAAIEVLGAFLSVVKSVWDLLKNALGPVFQILGTVVKAFGSTIGGLLRGALWVVAKAFEAVAWVVGKLADGIKWLWDRMKGFASWLMSGFLSALNIASGGVASITSQVEAMQAAQGANAQPGVALSAAAMAELSAAIDAQTKKLQEQFSVMGMSAEAAERFRFAQRGASDEMLRSFDLVVESMALEKKRQDAIKVGADVQQRLNDQIQRHFMSANALEDMRLAQQGVNAETLDAIRISRDYLAQLDAMEKLRERAGQIRGEIVRPFDDLKKQIEELQSLFDQDLLSFDEFASGLSRVMSQADQAREQAVGPRAFEVGTSEAVSAVNRAVRDSSREDPQNRIARLLEEQKRKQDEQLRQDRRLLDAFLEGRIFGTVEL